MRGRTVNMKFRIPTQADVKGGGGVQGVRTPPLLGHDVGFLTLGPKLDPPFLLVDLRCSGGSRGG